jgi:ABC-type transport system involved in multi-copper enzyme maturation permease subunit
MRTKTPSSKLLGLAFIAGFLAVPLFHQPMLALLGAVGVTSAVPYLTRPIPPLGVPQLVSQAFWGGVWGIVFALVAPRFPRGIGYWIIAVLFGALALSFVAWFIVAPLKGLPVAGGGRPTAIATALLVNGAWGFGTALLLLAFRKVVEEGRIT